MLHEIDSCTAAPCYPPVICVKSDVVLARLPSKPMLCLLESTDLQEEQPDHCIHYYVEDLSLHMKRKLYFLNIEKFGKRTK